MRTNWIARAVVGGAATAPLLVALVPGASSFSRWTVLASPNPGVYGNLFNGISGRSATDIWAVGGSASSSNKTLAAHWNGSSWTVVATPDPLAYCQDGNIQWTGNTLKAVAAVSAKDVWAVGHSCYSTNTLAEHWNGTSWRIVASPSFATGGDGIQNALNGVAVLSSSNVWAAGFHTASSGAYKTLVEHWNGTKWSVVQSPALRGSVLSAVEAVSPTDVWAVGSRAASAGASVTLVEHWNGSRWSVVPSSNLSTEYGSANVLRGIAAVSASDVWAVGMFQNEHTDYHQHRTLALHWDGVAWKVFSSPTPGASGELNAVATLPTGQVWGAGLYSNYDINIYDGSYTDPRTLAVRG